MLYKTDLKPYVLICEPVEFKGNLDEAMAQIYMSNHLKKLSNSAYIILSTKTVRAIHAEIIRIIGENNKLHIIGITNQGNRIFVPLEIRRFLNPWI
ncbi:hypothetical protein ACFL6I_02590 [candidate division KSB1 bacterium]